jgi:hypothetical protein
MKKLDLTGLVFGQLKVLHEAKKNHSGAIRWCCQCSCGKKTTAATMHLRRGHTKSCGCLREACLKAASSRFKTHGMSKTAENVAWSQMIARCSSRNKTKDRKNYFERGIAVSPEWIGPGGFQRFFSHVGLRPSPAHSLDREDNDGNYEPGNVRWATAKEQVNNRRVKRLDQFSDAALLAECKRRGFVF